MIVNIIETYRDVIAICDAELLGKTFEEPFDKGTKQLDVKESFYKGKKGKKVSEKELLEIIKTYSKEDATFNIIGKKATQTALKAGIITENSIKKIKNIPYSMVLM